MGVLYGEFIWRSVIRVWGCFIKEHIYLYMGGSYKGVGVFYKGVYIFIYGGGVIRVSDVL